MSTFKFLRIKWCFNFKPFKCMKHTVGSQKQCAWEKYIDTERLCDYVFLKRQAFFWKCQIRHLLWRPKLYPCFCWFSGFLKYIFLMFLKKKKQLTNVSKFSEVKLLNSYSSPVLLLWSPSFLSLTYRRIILLKNLLSQQSRLRNLKHLNRSQTCR